MTNYHVSSGSNPYSKPTDAQAVASVDETVPASPLPRRVVDINERQVCKNKGCGQTFKEKDNHETACSYHPGPAIFHDRVRGVRRSCCFLCMSICKYLVLILNETLKLLPCFQWKCCDIHVKEFDEFMSIPPCTKGWHNADPTSQAGSQRRWSNFLSSKFSWMS